jgi:hypothetical protein
MTTTQVNAMRNMWEAVTSQGQSMTAREMALTSHNLNRTGSRATTNDGAVWTWDSSRELWVK